MQNQLLKLNDKVLDAEQVTLIKTMIAPNTTDDELSLFLAHATASGLNPFNREIYAIKRRSKVNNGYVEKMSIQVGIDGFYKILNRNPNYNGIETFWCGKDGVWRDCWLEAFPPDGCKAIITLKSGGKVTAFCKYDSYKQANPMWEKMPERMIQKCAEAAAIRKVCPELAGIYEPSEPIYQPQEHPPVQDTAAVELADADLLNDFELKAESMVALQLMTEAKMTESLAWAKTAAKTTVEAQMAKWDKEIKANHDKALAEKGGSE